MMKFRKILLSWSLCWLATLHPQSEKERLSFTQQEEVNLSKPNPKAHYYSMAIQGAIILGGAYFWNYSERWTGEFGIENEGWFGKESYNGGADKLGHTYTWFLLTVA